jgi:hypothetical protein
VRHNSYSNTWIHSERQVVFQGLLVKIQVGWHIVLHRWINSFCIHNLTHDIYSWLKFIFNKCDKFKSENFSEQLHPTLHYYLYLVHDRKKHTLRKPIGDTKDRFCNQVLGTHRSAATGGNLEPAWKGKYLISVAKYWAKVKQSGKQEHVRGCYEW